MCQLAPNRCVKNSIVEIDCKENLQSTRPSQKKGRHVVVGNLFRKITVYK